MAQPSDIEIARSVEPRPIVDIAQGLGIPERYLRLYGREIAKVSLDYLTAPAERPAGRLILVTAVSPTPAGEGKTTTAVGLTDGLNRLGKQAVVCLREPSLGPSFGMKGGAAGGGYAQVIPMEEINLHFTGDFHAIGAAHNLLAALIDNHIYWRNELGFDFRRVAWRRVLDLNDRSLRAIVSSLGGVANGFPRETGFDITAASEVMAIFCLAENLAELERRLARVVIGYTRQREPLRAGDLEAQGPMSALLKDAFAPNLVQTLEGNPAFIHGGPFANIAHGCNSVIATRAALGLADYVVTEAGFGADLGAEKFFDIKCRSAGFKPDAAVLVATARALKYHGGAERRELGRENLPALEKGLSNMRRHIRNLAQFGVPVVVTVNRFAGDSDAEIKALTGYCRQFGVEVIESRHWSEGGAGAETLAAAAAKLADSGASCFVPLYDAA
ncbi:MAG: formate--tetrahydrofolate ligase, partial [Pseudomonadota bacterium]|nr:formate--tetrahydrofolate ligase [Pseudomonadota bacterium]